MSADPLDPWPFSAPNKTASYLLEWVKGAKSEYDLDIDYVGIWNERASDATYVETLRKYLDEGGFRNTRIVAMDGSDAICDELAQVLFFILSIYIYIYIFILCI